MVRNTPLSDLPKTAAYCLSAISATATGQSEKARATAVTNLVIATTGGIARMGLFRDEKITTTTTHASCIKLVRMPGLETDTVIYIYLSFAQLVTQARIQNRYY